MTYFPRPVNSEKITSFKFITCFVGFCQKNHMPFTGCFLYNIRIPPGMKPGSALERHFFPHSPRWALFRIISCQNKVHVAEPPVTKEMQRAAIQQQPSLPQCSLSLEGLVIGLVIICMQIALVDDAIDLQTQQFHVLPDLSPKFRSLKIAHFNASDIAKN